MHFSVIFYFPLLIIIVPLLWAQPASTYHILSVSVCVFISDLAFSWRHSNEAQKVTRQTNKSHFGLFSTRLHHFLK